MEPTSQAFTQLFSNMPTAYAQRNNSHFFEALIANMTDGIVLLNAEGIVTYQSPAASQISGFSNEDVIGANVFNFVADESKEDLLSFIQVVLASPGVAMSRSFKILNKNGGSKWIEGAMTNMLHDPHINALIANYSDITLRKESEMQGEMLTKQLAARVKELSDYKYAIDESSILAITDKYGKIRYANDNFCNISKYTLEELVGQDHRIINSGHHPKSFFVHLWKTISSGKVWRGEIKNKAKDGSYYWVDGTIVPFLDETGKPYQYVSIRTDITEKKKIEKWLEKSEANLRTVFEHTDNAYVLIDTNLSIIAFNGKARQFAQKDLLQDLEIGKNAMDCFIERRRPAVKQMIDLVFAGQDISYEVCYPQTDGEEVWYMVRMACVRNEARTTVMGLTMAITDISMAKKAEREIRLMNEELEMRVEERTAALQLVNNELEAFTYSVSHDLRTPARLMSGMAKVLSTNYAENLTGNAKELVQEMYNCSKHMELLINDLLQLSKSASIEIAPEEVDMRAILEVAIMENKEHLNPKAHIVINDLCTSMGDKSLLKQVWANLVANALKYSSKEEQPVIEIGSRREKGSVVYYVKDNGVGFNPSYQHKLFSVFQRLHNSDDFEGTGVGLALVQRIVHRHCGHVWAESKPNEGASFYFSLPSRNNETAFLQKAS